MPVVDSHCHLDVAYDVVGHEPAHALAQARKVNITHVVQIGCYVKSSRWAVEATTQFDNVIAAVALHPNDAARMGRTELAEA